MNIKGMNQVSLFLKEKRTHNFGQNQELPTLVIGFGFHGLAIPSWIKTFLKKHSYFHTTVLYEFILLLFHITYVLHI